MDSARSCPSVATTLWFIRHGEVAPEYVGTFVGTLDVPLSPMGRHQAAAIDVFLQGAGLDAIITSPRQRAMETAKPSAEAAGIETEVRPAFAEMDFGEWEGLHWDDIAARDLQFASKWQEDPANLACPGGEAAGQFAVRVQSALGDLLEEFDGRNVALFAHAGVNRAIMASVIGIPYMQSFSLAQDYGCVNAAGWQAGLSQVALVNFVPGPRSELQGDGRRVEHEAPKDPVP